MRVDCRFRMPADTIEERADLDRVPTGADARAEGAPAARQLVGCGRCWTSSVPILSTLRPARAYFDRNGLLPDIEKSADWHAQQDVCLCQK
jgi:hypothetical protein